MAVDRVRLAAGAAAGDASAERALAVTQRTSFMLSGAQLGITVTGLLVGYVAEPLIGQALGELLEDTGVAIETGIAAGTVLALIVATVVQMVVGELYPKKSRHRQCRTACALARPLHPYLYVFVWRRHQFF